MKRILSNSAILLSAIVASGCHGVISFDPSTEPFEPPISEPVKQWVAKRQQDDAYFRVVADLNINQAGLNDCERPKIPLYNEYEHFAITAQVNYGWFSMSNPVPIGYFNRDANAEEGSRCQFSGAKIFLTPWLRIQKAPIASVAFSIERSSGSSLDTANIQSITNKLTELSLDPQTKLASNATIAIVNEALNAANILLTQYTKKGLSFHESVDLAVSGTSDLNSLGRTITFTKTNNDDSRILIGTLKVYLEFTRSVMIEDAMNTGPELYAPKPDDDILTAARSYTIQMTPTNQESLQSYFSIKTQSPTLDQIKNVDYSTVNGRDLALDYCLQITDRLSQPSSFPFNKWDRAIAYQALFRDNQGWRNGDIRRVNGCTKNIIHSIDEMKITENEWPTYTRGLFRDIANSFTMANPSRRTAALRQFFDEEKPATFANYTTLLDSGNDSSGATLATRLAKLQIAPNACVLEPSEDTPQKSTAGRILFRALTASEDSESVQPTNEIYEIDARFDFAYDGSIIALKLLPAKDSALNLATVRSDEDPSCAALLKAHDTPVASRKDVSQLTLAALREFSARSSD